MDRESPVKAIVVVTLTALVCSLLVSATAVILQPIQAAYRDLERIAVIVRLSGQAEANAEMSDLQIIAAYQDISLLVADLESGSIDDSMNPEDFMGQEAVAGLQQAVPIPPELDLARLGTRPRWVTIYQLEDAAGLTRLILPVYGQGMWSTIRGYLALEPDLSTIAEVVFHEHGETAGIGDRITNPDWLAGWRQKKLFDEQGRLQFSIGAATTTAEAGFRVDGIAGASVTVDGVTNLVRYWFGPHGYGPVLQRLGSGGES